MERAAGDLPRLLVLWSIELTILVAVCKLPVRRFRGMTGNGRAAVWTGALALGWLIPFASILFLPVYTLDAFVYVQGEIRGAGDWLLGALFSIVSMDGFLTGGTLVEGSPSGGAVGAWLSANGDAVWFWIAAAWLAGALYFLARRHVSGRIFKRMLKEARPVDDPKVGDCVERVGQLCYIHETIRVHQLDRPCSPFIHGVRKPSIYFPSLFLAHAGPNDLKAIIGHELAHVQRYDLAAHHAVGYLRIVFWFLPAAASIQRELHAAQDFACDEYASTQLGDPGDYCNALTRFASMCSEWNIHRQGLGLCDDGQSLVERLKHLLGDPERRFTRISPAQKGAMAAFGFCWLFLAGLANHSLTTAAPAGFIERPIPADAGFNPIVQPRLDGGWENPLANRLAFAEFHLDLRCAAVADWDGDGFPDIAAGGGPRERNVLFVNRGFGPPITSAEFGVRIEFVTDIAIANLDGSGRAEIAALSEKGNLTVYTAGDGGEIEAVTGPPVSGVIDMVAIHGGVEGTDFLAVLREGDGGSWMARAELGRDGQPLELTDWFRVSGVPVAAGPVWVDESGAIHIVALFAGAPALRLFSGAAVDGEFGEIPLGGPFPETITAIRAADLDGDGLTDLILATGERELTAYRSAGGGRFEPFGEVVRPPVPFADFETGLLDGNEFIDIVCVNPFESKSAIVWNAFTEDERIETLGEGNERTAAAAIADFDRDGDLDIVSINRGGPSYLHFNSTIPAKRAITPPAMSLATSAPAAATVELIHPEPDGAARIFMHGSMGGAVEGDMEAFPGGVRFTAKRSPIAGETVDIGVSRPADGGGNITIRCQARPRASRPRFDRAGTPFGPPGGGDAVVALADLNGDGLLDILAGGPRGAAVHFAVRGERYFETARLGRPDEEITVIAAGDFNNDGAPDVLLCNAGGGPNRILYNGGGGRFERAAELNPWHGRTAAAAIADLNADGFMDAAAANRLEDGSTRFTVYLNLGGGGEFLQNHFGLGLRAEIPFLLCADLNLDGHQDILAGQTGGESHAYFLNNGRGEFFDATGRIGGIDSQRFAAADWNRDSLVDFVFHRPGGVDGGAPGIAALTNLGGGRFRESLLFPLPPGSGTVRLAAADLDGDADWDVLAAAGGGEPGLFALINEGERGFELLPISNRPPSAVLDMAVGDLEGDGDLDIAATSEDGQNRIYWNESRVDEVAGMER